MSEHVDVSNIKDPSIAAARKEVEFQRAMNPCPCLLYTSRVMNNINFS